MQPFWKYRTEKLLNTTLKNVPDIDWKYVYYEPLKNRRIEHYIRNNDPVLVEVLLQDPEVDLKTYDKKDFPTQVNRAIKLAFKNGYYRVAELLLLDGRINPAEDANFAICLASENGH